MKPTNAIATAMPARTGAVRIHRGPSAGGPRTSSMDRAFYYPRCLDSPAGGPASSPRRVMLALPDFERAPSLAALRDDRPRSSGSSSAASPTSASTASPAASPWCPLPRAARHCGELIRPYDNVPVLSFLLLGGRCRYCRTLIPLRYPVGGGHERPALAGARRALRAAPADAGGDGSRRPPSSS